MTRTNAMRYRRQLSIAEFKAVDLVCAGAKSSEVARLLNVHPAYPRQLIARACRKLRIKGRQRLAVYWKCELFRVGLKELRLI